MSVIRSNFHISGHKLLLCEIKIRQDIHKVLRHGEFMDARFIADSLITMLVGKAAIMIYMWIDE